MSMTKITPTYQDINECKNKIDAYIDSIDKNPERRAGAYPYYQFHEPGEPIYGTVIMFHGFSGKPHQMWRLSAYLFENGFNVYQCSLASHALINPDKNWPQIDLKSEYRDPLLESIRQDPLLSDFLLNLGGKSENFSIIQKRAIAARILRLNPLLLGDMIKALLSNNDPDFDKYFVSSHMDYLNNARERLKELETMPGEIYTVGLSVGGATALALAQDQPTRIKKVVAYAPLLNPVEQQAKEWQINLIGVLDIRETGWDPNLQFPVGCLSAVNRFGDFVQSKENYKKLKNTPTFLVLTENEDAADTKRSQEFFDNIGGEAQGHRCFLYDKSDLVPHPMIDPIIVSQGMTNHFWQSLYQESYRFLTTGEVVTANMDKLEQAQDLPLVKPV